MAVTGSVPAGGVPYCLCLAQDGAYAVGSPFPGSCLVSSGVTPAGTSYSTLLSPLPSGGPFRIVLLDGSCGGQAQPVLAVSESFAPTANTSIPSLSGYGLFVFLGLVATTGFLLIRRFQ